MNADATPAANQVSLARGIKRPWLSMPEPVRARAERELASQVVSSVTQSGGFTPGVAARLALASGERAFIKAISAEPNPDSPASYRAEAIITAGLPAGIAPRLLASFEEDGWVVLLLDDIDGHLPALPWLPGELNRVLAAIASLASMLTPAPASVQAPSVTDRLRDDFRGWRQLAADAADGSDLSWLDPWAHRNLAQLAALEGSWEHAARGNSLAHGDLRSDNLLLTDDRVYVVDWPSACIALTGYFLHRSRQPSPPGLPTVRAFQYAQGEASLAWLRLRTGWQ